jgi:site-specific DNA recombinase
MRAAIYARVSTDRQGREQTIESQLTALQAWVTNNGHELLPEHVFRDEGYSGSRLDRPGLDRLRDAAHETAFDVLGVFSPDRLARKYAYQVLLLEELRKAGCTVVFLQHPISEDPHDQLLLQIQGAVAEYERAVLAERFRRGKLQKARQGQWIGSKPPYGYRHVPKRDGVHGHLIIDEAEADLVRSIYAWSVEERLTIRQILKRLNAGPWRPRSGRRTWSGSVVHHILSDPVYTGTAYANRYHFVPPKSPRSCGRRRSENSCRKPRHREEWIPVPVPAIIDHATHERAQEQLARNAVLSFRHNIRYRYLLRCLLTCQTCGLAMHGMTHRATARQSQRRYYKCRGKDCLASGRERPCSRRLVKIDDLDAAVWGHIKQLLSDPQKLVKQFQNFTRNAETGDPHEQAEGQRLDAQIQRLTREDKRLIDAYQAGAIPLVELSQRRQRVEEQRRTLIKAREQQVQVRRQARKAQEVLTDLTAFCERIHNRLEEATFEDKQAILQLLIERIIVGDNTLEIRHVIPLRGPSAGAPTSETADGRLRPDGVLHPSLVRMDGEPREMYAPLGNLHDRKQVVRDQATTAPDLDRGEVDRGQHVPMGLQKRLPC